jgi:Ca2+-binding RTX toxin-like protein
MRISGTNVVSVAATGEARIDGLMGGAKWTGALTWSAPATASSYGSVYSPNGELKFSEDQFNTYFQSAFGSAQYDAFKLIISELTQFTNLQITESESDSATFRLGNLSEPTAGTEDRTTYDSMAVAFAYFPQSDATHAGDIWFRGSGFLTPTIGTHAYATLLHEFGHALGLKHGHENFSVYGVLPPDEDYFEYSLMTYNSWNGGAVGSHGSPATDGQPQSWMMLDIRALQHLYGANYGLNDGNTRYKFSPDSGQMTVYETTDGATTVTVTGPTANNKIFRTIWDGDGTDTYDFSSYTTGTAINLGPGGYSFLKSEQLAVLHVTDSTNTLARGNVYNALLWNEDLRSIIENAIGGSGNDIIHGNAVANVIRGGAGKDSIYSGDGNDTLYGADLDLIENGGFEGATADLAFGSDGYSNDPFKVGGWLNFGTGREKLVNATVGLAPSEGRRAIDLESSDGNGDLRQQIDRAQEGVRYKISFDIAKLAGVDASLEVRFGSETFGPYAPTESWQTITIEVTGGSGSGNEGTYNLLRFIEKGGIDGRGTLLDNVRMYRADGMDPTTGFDTGFYGDDYFEAGTGVDAVWGNAGDDTAKFDDMDNDAFDGGAGTDTLVMDWSTSASAIRYRKYNDTNSIFIGTAESFANSQGAIYFANVEQFDLTGSNFNDGLVGGTGNDHLKGGNGNDTFETGGGVDIIDGGAGDDLVILTMEVPETIDRTAAASETGFTLSNGTKLISIESIGIKTGEGNDTFDVRGTRASGIGSSVFDGGKGNDTFKVDLANSSTTVFYGMEGEDLFVMDWSAAETNITFFEPLGTVLGYRQWEFRTGPAEDTDLYTAALIGVERVELIGGKKNDDLRGWNWNDVINPGLGRDKIDFGEGTDTLVLDWQHISRNLVYGTASLPWKGQYSGFNYSTLKPIMPEGTLETGYKGAFSFWADSYFNGTTDRVDFEGVENFKLTLGPGGDKIGTGDGDDVIIGNGGGDWYATGKGFDEIDSGGVGYDGARWEADKTDAGAMTIDLNAAQFTYTLGGRTATIKGVNVLGTDADRRFKTGSGNDVITAALNTDGGNYLDLGGGDDTFTSKNQADNVVFGTGSDTLILDHDINLNLGVTGSVSGSLQTGYSGSFASKDNGGTEFSTVTFTGAEKFDLRLGRNANHNVTTGDGADSVSIKTGRSVVNMGGGSDVLKVDWSTVGTTVKLAMAMTGGAQGYSGNIDSIVVPGGLPGNKVDFTGVDRFELTLGSGSDDMINSDGADIFDGRGGGDLVVYAGNQSQYAINVVSSTEVQITRNGVTDILRNIELVQFADGSRVFGDVFSADRTTRGLVQVNGSQLTSRIDSATDQDWVRVDLVAGTTYTFSMNAAPGSSLDPYIFGLYSSTTAAGTFITGTGNDNFVGLNARVTYTATQTGTYFLSLRSSGNTSGDYVLTATSDAPRTNQPSEGDDVLEGDGEPNFIDGLGGHDRISGFGGNDILVGGAGNDTLFGGEGDDSLFGGTGGDALHGEAGFDYVRYDGAASGVAVFTSQPGANTGEAAGDTYTSIEGFVGSNFSDTIIADEGVNVLIGLNGHDVLFGAGGNDSLYGANGEDSLFGGTGADYLDGGLGFDYARYDFATSGVALFMLQPSAGAGEASGDTLVDIEGVLGSSFNDTLSGGLANDTLLGSGGHDVLFGWEGTDYLNGGTGDDSLFGGLGADYLVGDAGFDWARYDFSAAPVAVNMAGTGFGGEADGDSYSGIEGVVGSDFGDYIVGDGVSNVLSGGLGNDVLVGGGGGDALYGGAGVDTLYGQAGNDGLHGGDGIDFFMFARGEGPDQILDFSSSVDKIGLSAATFGNGLVSGGSLAGRFAYNAADSAQGQFVFNTANNTLYWDSNGTGSGGLEALAILQNGAALTQNDLVLY